jgi:hypothetical protein
MSWVYRGVRAAGAEYRSRSVAVCTIPDLARPSTADAYQVPTQMRSATKKAATKPAFFILNQIIVNTG